jgi:hypothetical protein
MSNTIIAPKPSPQEMMTTLDGWHAHYCDDPLYYYIQTNFEEMRDVVYDAYKNEKAAKEEADWAAREMYRREA